MKVYLDYEIPEFGDIAAINNLSDAVFTARMEREKYKTMWQLRSLEDEINSDGGQIIIASNGRIHIKGFKSQSLVDRIKVILAANES